MAKLIEIVSTACNIIFSNEGNYGSINKNDNGAVSIGKVQWHGNRALALLKTVVSALGAAKAKSILGDTLHTEITNSKNWGTRIVNTSEAAALSKLLLTADGKRAQDELAAKDVTTYINKGKGYGLVNAGALIYFADGVNQYGTASSLWKNIAKDAIATTGDVEAMYKATCNRTSNYLSRRKSVYNKLKSLSIASENLDGNTQTKPKEETVQAAEIKTGDTYKVTKGDTLSKIATIHGTTVDNILAANKAKYPKITRNYIIVGWELIVNKTAASTSSNGSTSAKATTHKVAKGDTLSKIAARYATTVDNIVAANKAKYPKITRNFIVTGWVLNV